MYRPRLAFVPSRVRAPLLMTDDHEAGVWASKDGRMWRMGKEADVAWIRQSTAARLRCGLLGRKGRGSTPAWDMLYDCASCLTIRLSRSDSRGRSEGWRMVAGVSTPRGRAG